MLRLVVDNTLSAPANGTPDNPLVIEHGDTLHITCVCGGSYDFVIPPEFKRLDIVCPYCSYSVEMRPYIRSVGGAL